MRASPKQIADYFLSIQDIDAGEAITHLKLQKLVYYSAAWSLALDNEDPFPDDLEAWQHGPVVRALYAAFAGHGFNPIPASAISTDLDQLGDDDKELLDDVWEVYGQFSAKKLEQLTHNEKPWRDARKGLSPIARSTTAINKDTMRSFYTARYDEQVGRA